VVPDRIAQVAVELFATRGYDVVSMSEIADAAGVSRRALFNHFPSKAALVWVSFEPFMDSFDAALAAIGPRIPLLDGVADALLESFGSLGVDAEFLRTRLQIVGSHPDLLVYGAAQMGAVRARLQRFVELRCAEPTGSLESLALAQALTSVAFEAFQQWAAAAPEASPRPIVTTMLHALSAASIDRGT
jgi:AcrR family transcriptional regulator